MLRKRDLTVTTLNTLLLGVASNKVKSAATAAIRLDNGEIEGDCGEYIAPTVWEAVELALRDLQILRLRQLMVLTTDDVLVNFLHKPFIAPTEQQEVITHHPPEWVKLPNGQSVKKTQTKSLVGYGGNEHQWALLRLLFPYVWQVKRVEKLPKAEGLI